jgi:hypothetical protein
MSIFHWLTAERIEAFAALVNVLAVAVLARLTYLYLKSTRDLVGAAREQTEAAKQQATSAARTIEILLLEKRETQSYQRAVFISECYSLIRELSRVTAQVKFPTKPYRPNDVYLIPSQWELCREFVARQAPEAVAAMLALQGKLIADSEMAMGVLRAPDTLWLATVQKREVIAKRLQETQDTVIQLQKDVLAAADKATKVLEISDEPR